MLQASAFTFCEASVDTIRYVEECPTNAKEWTTAARNKNCDSIQQNCSKRTASNNQRYVFQYHCVITVWRNATLEVCALNRTILGKTIKNIQLLETKVLIHVYLYFTFKTKMNIHVNSCLLGITFPFYFPRCSLIESTNFQILIFNCL